MGLRTQLPLGLVKGETSILIKHIDTYNYNLLKTNLEEVHSTLDSYQLEYITSLAKKVTFGHQTIGFPPTGTIIILVAGALYLFL
ncbi:MAG: hypothetical protein AAF984_05520 [Verrucomicrobiota bacterium]